MSYQRSNIVIRMKVRPNPVYSSIIFKLKVWGFLTSHWSGHFFRKFDIRKIQICPWALVWVFHIVHLAIKPQRVRGDVVLFESSTPVYPGRAIGWSSRVYV